MNDEQTRQNQTQTGLPVITPNATIVENGALNQVIPQAPTENQANTTINEPSPLQSPIQSPIPQTISSQAIPTQTNTTQSTPIIPTPAIPQSYSASPIAQISNPQTTQALISQPIPPTLPQTIQPPVSQQIPQSLPQPFQQPTPATPQIVPPQIEEMQQFPQGQEIIYPNQQIPNQQIPNPQLAQMNQYPTGYFPYQIYPPVHPEIPIDPMSELITPTKKYNKISLTIVILSISAITITIFFGYPYIKTGLSKGVPSIQKNEEQKAQNAPEREIKDQFETEVENTTTEKQPIDTKQENPTETKIKDPNAKEVSATIPEATTTNSTTEKTSVSETKETTTNTDKAKTETQTPNSASIKKLSR